MRLHQIVILDIDLFGYEEVPGIVKLFFIPCSLGSMASRSAPEYNFFTYGNGV
jgi:hypothetical protein